ncbi:pseudouridine-5'-phosphate glycosidase [Halobacteriovorax sp. HLS]|uniref:pseudouridine-5'-phosphate glycosidase n=1 Tax=Halobacteriovorax sp. HLS TaxID=2234000 RepID=UPI000FDBF35A|nr:pseudouridine-5'-phosphate glycosidase [Halobacteriovorax sp. HLS]
MNNELSNYITFSEDVEHALLNAIPVVALESTIISHGMSYPKNLETAKKVEGIVRANGAVPATIAIIKGKLKIGLDHSELELLAKEGQKVHKTSRRDIPYVVSSMKTGATTVAATMFISSLAGIKVFATGGIGGVHRGASQTFDISADLQELGKTNVAVICAGIKSILDIGLTLEYLETYGVPVLGNNVEQLPAFYSRESDFKVNFKMNNEKEIADFLKVKWDLGLKGGVVIGNPVPAEFSYDKSQIDAVINDAIKEMNEKEIVGKESTPFLLKRISELTKGKSLDSNIELVLNNARVASLIAVELSRL